MTTRDIFSTGRLAALAAGFALAASSAAAESLQFNRDIRPILSENCFACHGPDPGSRKAGLRLDTQEGLFEATPKRGPGVVPGKPEESEIWKRILHADPDEVMPPPDSNKTLTSGQRELIKRWIAEGAAWQPHWSFVKPSRPAVPKVADPGFPIRNPIDAFILAKLQEKGLAPAPEADRRALARRLALDTTGLPPAPAEVEAFAGDNTWEAYERHLGSLMRSPRWGEHRGRYWLDAARYADTHGLHFDNYREMWPYRDWVIRAFNENMPFDEFTLEQIAGDLLPNATDAQKIATGFHRCNATTNEGGTIEAENLAAYANDRVTTTSWVWLGLTSNCAACHDHKFDPISTKDFYSMAAYFRNTKQSGFDRNLPEGDLFMVVPQTAEETARWKALPSELEEARKAKEENQARAEKSLESWLATATAADVVRAPDFEGEALRLPLNEGVGSRSTGRVNGRRAEFAGPEKIEWRQDGPLGPAAVLPGGDPLTLGDLGGFDLGDSATFGAWVRIPEDHKGDGSIMARMKGAADGNAGWDLYLTPEGHVATHFVQSWPNFAMKARTSDPLVKRGQWHHVMAVYGGSNRPETVRIYVDGVEAKMNRERDRLQGSFRVDVPLRLGRRESGSEIPGLALQDVRIYSRRLDAREIRALALAPKVAAALATPAETRSDDQKNALKDYHLAALDSGWRGAAVQVAALEGEQAGIRARSPVTHVQMEKPDSEPFANVLFRGQYDQPRDKVGPGVIHSLHPLPPGAPNNRLGLAQWLVDPENPLTARVTVNRFWQEIFGVGLVKTSEDMGIMGESPSNQDLLDWLAVEFVESGWDVRHMFKLMLTSSTYRQSAETTPEKIEKDPENRLLSRGPRFRMDAEMIRDLALEAGGLLSPQVGGPSVRPYQPEGVWEAVAMPESNTRHYRRDSGEALYRRGMYTFWKRAAPPAMMDIFNAPSRESCSVRRERTNTPLQALATLNDPQFIEAARVLAAKALRESRGCEEKAVGAIAQRILSRPPTQPEMEILLATLDDMRAHYTAHLDDARGLLEVGEQPAANDLGPAQLAAMTLVANQILNLDEALNK